MADRLHRGRLLVDRALHPWRRWRLVRRLRRMPRPRAVLVMCSGNICRSPFAAALLARALLPLGISVHSGGLTGPGRRSPAAAVAAARRYDVALDEHRAVVVAPGAFPAADLVIVMDPIQRRILRRDLGCRDDAIVLLGDLDPAPIATRYVVDPIDRPPEVYEEVYARIARCVGALAALLAAAAPATDHAAARTVEAGAR
ncbi:MAG TPA: hypothetical protein VFS07_09430 [Gemmatimonadales bacterium]|nr:hypothetical protein [Gemmatimonadales bacterium]